MNYLSPVEGHSTPAFSNVPKFISMLQPRGQGPLKIPTLRLYFGPLESEPLGVGGVQASAVFKNFPGDSSVQKIGVPSVCDLSEVWSMDQQQWLARKVVRKESQAHPRPPRLQPHFHKNATLSIFTLKHETLGSIAE